MKSSILLLFMLMAYGLQAQYSTALSWSLPGHTYSSSDFQTCKDRINFKVTYQHCSPLNPRCIRSGTLLYQVLLFRGNTYLKTFSTQGSSTSVVASFNDILVTPGNYKAVVRVSMMNNSGGWSQISTANSNIITATKKNAVPNFNINGYGVPGNNIIPVCSGTILLNGTDTRCETRYYVGVQESDQWWNRTYQYEWGRWFTGEAPLIDLQQLSLISSVPPYFTGPASRQNQGLFGGNLPSGNARHYRINLCTNEPNWDCKIALIRVYGFCKTGSEGSVENMNEMFSAEHTELVALFDENNEEIPFDKSITTKDLLKSLDLTSTTMKVAPNPFSNATTISIDNYEGEAPIVFELFNALGERVKSVESSQTQFELQRDQLTAGIYLYRATANNKLIGSGKVVIE